jgi:hypothetical protein
VASAGTITVDAVLQSAQFVAELQKIERRTAGLERQLKSFSTSVNRAFGALAGAVSLGVIATGIQRIVDAADQLGDTAEKLNTTAEALQGLRLLAEDFGGSAQGMDSALQKLQKSIGDAATSGGPAAKAFQSLGLSARELSTLTTDEAFLRVAGALGQLDNQFERASISSDLFSKSYADIAGVLAQGDEAIRSSIDGYRRAGLILSNETVASLSLAERQIRVTRTAFGNLAAELVGGFSAALIDAGARIREGGEALGGLRQVGEGAAVALIAVFEAIRNGALTIQSAFFGVAAAGARVAQFLSFGSVSDAFKASVDENLRKADQALQQIRSIEQIQQRIAESLATARNAGAAAPPPVAAPAAGQSGVDPGLLQQFREKQFGLELDAETEQRLRADQQKILQIAAESEEERARVARAYAEERYQTEVDAQNAIVSVQQGAVQAGIGLLQTFAGRSKAIAVALVLVNRGLAIAQAIQNTAVAVTKALTVDPTGTLAARVALLGKIQIGLIAATGIGEIANIASGDAGGIGGTTLGTPNNPVRTDPQASADFGRVTRIEVVGKVTDGSGRVIADLVAKEVRERDLILIDPGSRNAQELIGG